MPDKEGSDDEKKSTKSVVNKKQKQILNQEEYISELESSTLGSNIKKAKTDLFASGADKMASHQSNPKTTYYRGKDDKLILNREKGIDRATDKLVKRASNSQEGYIPEEGYDIARDMGKVRPSKDKKDATTMQVSDEVKKTQKVVKGPSAFERVKAKYGKSVMNVGKKKANEELDLTQVAEALGGYIVEAPTKKPSYAYSRELGPQGRYQTKNIVKRALKAFPPEGQKLGDSDDAEIEKQILSARMDKRAMKQAGEDQLGDISKAKSPRGKPAQRIKGASGGKKTGSLRKGNLEFPGDRTGATQQTKADIEARQGIKDAGGTGDIGFKAPNRPEKVKKRTDRADAQGTPDPFSIDTSSAAAENAKRFGTPKPRTNVNISPTDAEYASLGFDPRQAAKGEKKSTVKSANIDVVKPLIDSERIKKNKADTQKADAFKKTDAYKNIALGKDSKGDYLTKDERIKAFQQNLTKGRLGRSSSELETGGGFDTGRSGESITRRPSKPDASPNVTVNVNQPKRDIDVKKTAGQIGRKFSDVATDAARSQSQSMMGAMGGMIGKSAFPDVAGAEAGVNLARGDKLGAALSLGQSLGGSLGFAAGVANAIRMRMPNYKVPQPVTPKFDPRSGGKLAKQGQVSMDTATGEREAKMSVGGMALGRVLRNVKNAAKQNARRATTVRGGKAIQVSAGK